MIKLFAKTLLKLLYCLPMLNSNNLLALLKYVDQSQVVNSYLLNA